MKGPRLFLIHRGQAADPSPSSGQALPDRSALPKKAKVALKAAKDEADEWCRDVLQSGKQDPAKMQCNWQSGEIKPK